MSYTHELSELRKKLMVNRYFDWRLTASPDELHLFDKVYGFSDLFEDMTFAEGSSTYDFVKCQVKGSDSDENAWIDDDSFLVPEELKYLSYGSFTYHVEDLGRANGRFSGEDFSISISPSSIDDDSVILHELIHLHEFVIDLLPTFFRDAILFCLYKNLSKKICDLDDRIEAHGHILNSSAIAAIGGTHDILFLLKSFDLDLRQGYKLGTVFGYGMNRGHSGVSGK